MKLSIQKKLCISRLFNKGGYVLVFSTTKFDDFTEECVGLRLTEHYSLSKGASLESSFLTVMPLLQLYCLKICWNMQKHQMTFLKHLI